MLCRAEAGEGDDEDDAEEDSNDALLLALEEDEEESVEEAKGDDEFSINSENKKGKKRKRASAKRGTPRSVKRKTVEEVTETSEPVNGGDAEQVAEPEHQTAEQSNTNQSQ